MLRANGEAMPVGDRSELRARVAILGGGAAGAVAAAIIRQQTPDQGVVIIEGRVAPFVGQCLTPEGVRGLQEIGLGEDATQSGLTERAVALGATVLPCVGAERVQTSADRIDRLLLPDGRSIVADWYIDTSRPGRDRATGENWLLCGEASDPNLSMALAIGRDAGCTVAALHRGEHDAQWLLQSYGTWTRIHLEQSARLARSRVDNGPRYEFHRYNIIKPNLVGATQDWIAEYRGGEVQRVPCYVRDGRSLPVSGVYEQLLKALKHHNVIADVLAELEQYVRESEPPDQRQAALARCADGLEVMLLDGWLIGRLDRRRPLPEWPDFPPLVRVLGSDDRTKAAAVEPDQRAIG